MRTLILAAVAATLFACSKDADKKPAAPPTAPVTAGTVGADGARRIAIAATNDGYTPGEITAKPNEKLILQVTRTVEGDVREVDLLGHYVGIRPMGSLAKLERMLGPFTSDPQLRLTLALALRVHQMKGI